MKTILRTLLPCGLLLVATATQAGGFRLPPYQRTVLDNGLTVVLMEQHEVPLIDVQVLVGGGAMADGADSGLAGLTADALLFGAGGLTKQDLDDRFDFIGAEVRTTADREYSSLRASFASRDQATVLPILRDLLRTPAFDDEEFVKHQRRHLAGLAQAKESPRAVIDNYFHRLLLGDHPYAAVPEGDAESVGRLTRADLVGYHEAWYQPQNTIICVVGDFDTAAMGDRLRDLFGDWPRGTAARPEAPPLPATGRARVLLVDKADAGEATFYFGGPGVAVTNEDRVGLAVVNTILGGRFTSWLNDELRVNAGLTYGARSSFDSYGRGGLFRVSTFTRTATAFEAIDLAREVYGRLWDQGIDAVTLASAKAYVKGQFPPRYETSGQLAGLLAEMQFYGYDETYIDRFEERVNRLDVAETRRLIDTWFPRENLQMVVIGEAAALRDGLAKYGEVTEVGIQQNGFSF